MNRNDILRTTMLNLGMKVEEDKTVMYLFDDKEFLTEDEVITYMEDNIGKFRDFYTNDDIPDIIDELWEDVEEIELEVEE